MVRTRNENETERERRMSSRSERRKSRRIRRVRSQIISYSVLSVVLAAIVVGCVVGIRAAKDVLQDRAAAKEASLQAALEASKALESAQAEEAVADLLDLNDTGQESAETYTPEEAFREMVEESIAGMTLEQKVAGLFFVTPEQLTGVGKAVQAGDGTREALAKYPVGGLVYFKQNIQSEEQLSEMLANTVSYSAFPLFLGVDEEGGQVARLADALHLEGKAEPAAKIGAEGDVQAVYAAYESIGNYLSAYGFNVNFAPVADVAVNPEHDVMGDRSFSTVPQTAADLVAGAVQGLQSTGVSACLKHFPGHGDVTGDSHTGAAVTTERSKEEMQGAEFLPFGSGIAAGADMVMVGHINAPALNGGENIPASLSEAVITGILRNELGYDGIVITDAMNMTAIKEYYEADVAAIMALKAGADMILMPDQFEQAYTGVLQAVQDGTISEERVNDSLKRIYGVKLRNRTG